VVIGNFSLDAVVLYEVDEESLGEAVSAEKADVLRLAGTVEVDVLVDTLYTADERRAWSSVCLEIEFLDRFVDGLLGHLPVGGPFASRDCDETGIRGGDEVITNKSFRLGLLWVANKRSNTRPGGKHISSADVNVGCQVVLNLLQNPLNLLLACNWVGIDRARCVGGTSDGVSVPGKEENYATV
jgi:hypothetical protein